MAKKLTKNSYKRMARDNIWNESEPRDEDDYASDIEYGLGQTGFDFNDIFANDYDDPTNMDILTLINQYGEDEDLNGDNDIDVATADLNGNGETDAVMLQADSPSEMKAAVDEAASRLDSTGTIGDNNSTEVSDQNQKKPVIPWSRDQRIDKMQSNWGETATQKKKKEQQKQQKQKQSGSIISDQNQKKPVAMSREDRIDDMRGGWGKTRTQKRREAQNERQKNINSALIDARF